MSRAGRRAVEASSAAIASPSVILSGEKSSGRMVTVACKIPNGIILQLCRETKYWEDTPSGSKERKRFDRAGPRYHVAGPAYPNGQAPKGYPERVPTAGGFALTSDIPKEFWDQWLEQNRETSFIVNGQVFAMSTLDSAQGKGREQKDIMTGFEAISQDLDPEKDPRLPKPIKGLGVSMVEAGERS